MYYIGVDIGTTSTKAVVFTKDGKITATAYKEYPIFSHTPIMAEQDPKEIFEAVIFSIRMAIQKSGINKQDIKLLSFSSAMHGVIAMDNNGEPLTQCITWADQRAHKYAMALRGTAQGQGIYQRTGTPLHAMSPLCKLLWFKNESQEIYHRAHKFIGIKEYVFYRLFGEYVIDHSLASATGMFNLSTLAWDEKCLAITGVSREQLPRPVKTTEIFGNIHQTYATQMGINKDTPFVIGASDGCLSNLGVNAIDPGVMAITIGTSAAIRTVTHKPTYCKDGKVFCYILDEGHYVVGGPINNGGIVLRWIRDQLCGAEMEVAKGLGVDPYTIMADIASKVNPGAEGLVFLPYLAGERAPLWDANARGAFIGLGLNHKKEHMIRAVFEGVILNIYEVMAAIEDSCGTPTKVQATGGFARSQLWRQMMADILDKEIAVPESIESSCLGAVVLGMKALGEIQDYGIMEGLVGETFTHSPSGGEVYRELAKLYGGLADTLRGQYGAIADFQQRFDFS